jgi:hypothetical protein
MEILQGKQIIPYVKDIAMLRLTAFREYPYLYEGTMEGEKNYLKIYTDAEDGIAVIAKDQGKIIGAITGLPLKDAPDMFSSIFKQHQIPLDPIFYLGEIVLLKQYRGKRIAFLIGATFEKQVKKMGRYKQLAICEIKRAEDDPKRPADYIPSTTVTNKKFIEQPDLVSTFSWKEIGDRKETAHRMVYFLRDL